MNYIVIVVLVGATEERQQPDRSVAVRAMIMVRLAYGFEAWNFGFVGIDRLFRTSAWAGKNLQQAGVPVPFGSDRLGFSKDTFNIIAFKKDSDTGFLTRPSVTSLTTSTLDTNHFRCERASYFPNWIIGPSSRSFLPSFIPSNFNRIPLALPNFSRGWLK